MKRIPELDGLRALAALAVIAHHLEIWPPVTFWCQHAVDLFFVLSGYLITGIILRDMTVPGFFGAFYRNRSIRIFPIYYLTLAAIVIAHSIISSKSHPAELSALPEYITYTEHVSLLWGRPTPPFFLEFLHAWTLALEEQFYLIWPGLLWLIGRRHALVASVAFVALALFARLHGVHAGTILGRCDGFAAGALLAVLLEQSTARRWLWLFIPMTLAGLLPLLFGAIGFQTPFYFTALFAVFGGLIGSAIVSTGAAVWWPLRSRILAWVAARSYGLYLYQMAVVVYGERHLARFAPWLPRWAVIIAVFAVSLCFAAASWTLIEKPLQRFKSPVARRAPQTENAPTT
jgi:peptidoglycan/LPS O-acetylase OafA/YrhL